MTAFAIAQYLPLEARQVACKATYADSPYTLTPTWSRRTQEGYCPLGVAFEVALPTIRLVNTAPNVILVGQRLRRFMAVRVSQAVLQHEASLFIEAWDRGEIPDLYDALDVPREVTA